MDTDFEQLEELCRLRRHGDTVPVLDTIKSLTNKFPALEIKEESGSDTIPQNINKNAENDSSIVMEIKDTFDLKISTDSLDAPIEYEAED